MPSSSGAALPRHAVLLVRTARSSPPRPAPPGSAPAVAETPVGQVVTAIGRENIIADRPATSVGSVLANSAGFNVRQGSGARDVVISIRGNNARSTGVNRNMVVLEDGFILDNANLHSVADLTGDKVLDTRYVASAQNLANAISGATGLQNGVAALAGTTGLISAGAPRTVIRGMRLSFQDLTDRVSGASPASSNKEAAA